MSDMTELKIAVIIGWIGFVIFIVVYNWVVSKMRDDHEKMLTEIYKQIKELNDPTFAGDDKAYLENLKYKAKITEE